MKQFVSLALLVVAHAAAFASYELALVADGRKIHRFDTDSGVYLGSFGRFASNVRDIATDPTTGYTFAADALGSITKYNYSTGNQESPLVQSFSTSLHLVGNEVWSQNGLTITRFNQNLVTLGTVTLATTNAVNSIHVLNGKIFSLESNAGTAFTRRYAMNGTFELALASYGSFTNSLGRMGSIRFVDGATTDLLLAGIKLTTVDSLAYTVLNGSTPSFSANYIPGLITTVRDVGATHAGGVYVGQNLANLAQGALMVVNHTAAEISVMGTSILTSPQAVNVIVAPEPGSMLAFGLGGLLLLRRKR